jgi:uncharacterized membrane protein YgaE (UPF0421/DUF939 family)
MENLVLNEKVVVPKSAHLFAAWPLLLIFIGGAIGVVFGAIAYVVNIQIYKSPTLSKLQKILANLLCGMSAISLWWFIATWVQKSF